MYLSRRYVVALVAALIALAAYVVVPKVANAINAQRARANLAAANAAFSHLRVPADFRPWPATNKIVCDSGLLCYYVAKPPTAISKAQLIGILQGIGARYDARPSSCFTDRPAGHPTIRGCTIYGRLDGLYVYASLSRYMPCDPKCRRTNEAQIWISTPFTPRSD
jgi:type II secretory pathway pseudopilin PulG